MAEGGQEIAEGVDNLYIARRERTYFFRNEMLVFEVGRFVLIELLHKLVNDVERNITFTKYLDKSEVRCELFHIWKHPHCCSCERPCRCNNKMKDYQWNLLYDLEMANRPTCKEVLNNRNSHCCLYNAKAEVLDDLDISMIRFIVFNLSDFKLDHLRAMIEKMKNYRNELAHSPGRRMKFENYESFRDEAKQTILELARLTGKEKILNKCRRKAREIEHMDVSVDHAAVLESYNESAREVQNYEDTFQNGNFDGLQPLNQPTNDNEVREQIDDVNTSIEHIQQNRRNLLREMNEEHR